MQLFTIALVSALSGFVTAAPRVSPATLLDRQVDCESDGCLAALEAADCLLDAGPNPIKLLLCIDDVQGGIEGVSAHLLHHVLSMGD